MMISKYLSRLLIAITCVISSSQALTEPLRIIVPEFQSSDAIGKYVMTTIYFELSKAFASNGTREKGALIIYGREKLSQQSHEAAIEFTRWPSTSADLVIWGNTIEYGENIVVPMSLTITPLTEKREVRPELWSIQSQTLNGESVNLSVGLPRLYYDLEPIVLPKSLVKAYKHPRGIPLYNSKTDGKIEGYAGDFFTFIKFSPEAVKLHAKEGIEGWARLPQLPDTNNHSIAFSKGMVRYLRGDWKGAVEQFQIVLENSDTPASLRIDTKILIGISKEQLGSSGVDYFKSAYSDNRLDRISAKYVMMGYISEIKKAHNKKDTKSENSNRKKLSSFVASASKLYSRTDPWIQKINQLISMP